MKTKLNSTVVVLTVLFLVPIIASAQRTSASAGRSAWSVGFRTHVEHDVFEELPFDNGDYSLAAAYEYHEATAYWQAAILYAMDADQAETVITPNINLIVKDQQWRAGIGVLMSYMEDQEELEGEESDDWTDIYWQLILGANLPLFGRGVDIFVNYTFHEWDEIDEIDLNDIEYGVWLNFSF